MSVALHPGFWEKQFYFTQAETPPRHQASHTLIISLNGSSATPHFQIKSCRVSQQNSLGMVVKRAMPVKPGIHWFFLPQSVRGSNTLRYHCAGFSFTYTSPCELTTLFVFFFDILLWRNNFYSLQYSQYKPYIQWRLSTFVLLLLIDHTWIHY